MTQKPRKTTDKALDSMERAAYAAIGAPVAAVKGLNARLSELRETLKKSRSEISDDLANEIDDWIAQGEDVFGRAMERFRSSNVAGEIRSSADSTREAMRGGLDKAKRATEAGLQVVAPDESLTTIKGVGPGYADRLRDAGVSGIAQLLAMTEDEIEKIASESGVGKETIIGWRSSIDLTRIDGVGDSYQTLLHRTGIWTMEQLAAANSVELIEQMRSVELPDAPDQMPSKSTVDAWKAQARKLAG